MTVADAAVADAAAADMAAADMAGPAADLGADADADAGRAGPRVAIVHEWLESYAGSERVLEQLIACFPRADIFTVVDFVPPGRRGFLGGRPVKTSFIQRLPFARRRFRAFLGLMTLAVEQFDLTGYDLVISSSHAVAKGVITGPDQLHISYVHSPMRYAWDLQHQYLRQANMARGLKSIYARWLLSRLRLWDVRTATSVDVFVANSAYIARRIRKAYRRDSVVIHPPVDVAAFAYRAAKSDYYFVVSRQVPYKRIDLIARAFARMPERKLIIVGDGPEHARVVEAAAAAPNITLRGAVEHAELLGLMQRARALVIAAEEDFGITMVEAQACGTPVIAFARGGARDIIADEGGASGGPARGPTGVLFERQTADSIIDAVARFERLAPAIAPEACRANAMRFTVEVFRERITGLVAAALAEQRRVVDRPADASATRAWLPLGMLASEKLV
jgi:glycosyltransferase involved in cell wall biosynthesis